MFFLNYNLGATKFLTNGDQNSMKISQTVTDTQRTRSLCDLQPGEAGVVADLEVDGLQRRRLMDLGLLPGTRVVVEMDSPLGDPTAYRIRGSVIALRRDQARLIRIKPEHKETTI
jgi:ferrous iron transport protein A